MKPLGPIPAGFDTIDGELAIGGIGLIPDLDRMATIAQPLDWLGVNYYTRHTVAHAPGAPWPAIRPRMLSMSADLSETMVSLFFSIAGVYFFSRGVRNGVDPLVTSQATVELNFW